MLSFRQYIAEVISIHKDGDDKTSHMKQMYVSEGLGKKLDTKGKTLAFKNGEHSVYVNDVDKSSKHIHVADKEGNLVTRIFLNKDKPDHAFHSVVSIASISKKYKAHELYRDLLHHGVVKGLKTDTQSAGGRHIWHNLSKYKDVTVHGWDPYHGEAINLGKTLPDEDETHVSISEKPKDADTKKIKRMELVAFSNRKN